MIAGAQVAISVVTLIFVFVLAWASGMTSQDDVAQAILDMRLRLDATEAALQQTRDDNVRLNTLLAQATTVGRPPPQPAPPPTSSSLVDTRLIGKPAVFAGMQEAWTDWSFVLEAYCSALSTRLVALMEAAQGQQS